MKDKYNDEIGIIKITQFAPKLENVLVEHLTIGFIISGAKNIDGIDSCIKLHKEELYYASRGSYQTYSEPISINPFEEVVVNYDEGEVRELYQLVLELRNHRHHHKQSKPLSAVDVIPHDNNRNIITLLNRLCGSTIGQLVGQDYKSFKANKIKLVRLLLQLNKCENLVAAIEQANKTVIIL